MSVHRHLPVVVVVQKRAFAYRPFPNARFNLASADPPFTPSLFAVRDDYDVVTVRRNLADHPQGCDGRHLERDDLCHPPIIMIGGKSSTFNERISFLQPHEEGLSPPPYPIPF